MSLCLAIVKQTLDYYISITPNAKIAFRFSKTITE